MTPAARHQKTIDILTAFWKETLPLDRVIKKRFQSARYMGSSDRRAVFQLIYDLMRCRQHLIEANALTPREELLLFLIHTGMSLFDINILWNGAPFHPVPLTIHETEIAQAFTMFQPSLPALANVPAWIFEMADLTVDEWQQLNKPASVDLWVNPLKTTPDILAQSLSKEGYTFYPLPHYSWALRGNKATQLDQTQAYRQGFFEFQDAAAQALCDVLPLPSQGRILDMCAGAGGKTLTLAGKIAANKNISCSIIATDIAPNRLKRAQYRLERADLHKHVIFAAFDIWEELGPYDGILIDAPCSGSGTWRRDPTSKWHLTPQALTVLNQIQLDLLTQAFKHVKLGGWVAYATCSLFHQENEAIITHFLHKNPSISPIKSYTWAPWSDNTDGFFLSILSNENKT